ncbi:hypothetical protein Lalb_Chr18g0047121 [Lupinus albus]|uniref:Peripheral-type benzodiazepine receptor n=1 Tax=Lupinus albus TaxID=3870 RepID=A0A6A4NXD0_LUPAL|nr:hypothetical protein Lalb_Chr18g0047121 [Lupinus albus]
MASNELKQRLTQNPSTTMNNKKRNIGVGRKRDKRMAMAKRGFKSLAIAVFLPLSLTLLSIYLGSSLHTQQHAHYDDYDDGVVVPSTRPFWFTPSWVLHLMCLASSFLMGISAWMVWADGGFHTNPVALLLYLAQILFTLLWDPLVFGLGATRVGLMVCLGLFGALSGCMHVFRQLNSVAGDFTKPCLACAAFLSVVNVKLLFV